MHWLQKHDKSIPNPLVVFTERSDLGGFYIPPSEKEVDIDGKFYDAYGRGVIVVSSAYPDNIAGTLAHEWRHHWQRFNRLSQFPYWPWVTPETWQEYDAALIRYFSVWHEYDALAFEYTYAKNDWNDYSFGLLAQK